MSRSELHNRFRHTGNIQHMVIVCQCCEPLFVLNGLWRWSLWLCALSSWRRLDSWGVETGEICDNIVARGGSFVSWYDCIMVSWYGCSLSKTLVGSCIAFFGLNCCLAGRSVASKAADISNSLINTYSFSSAVAGMVRNMCIWTVFCGHNWFLARRFWHYSGWPQLPVGGAG